MNPTAKQQELMRVVIAGNPGEPYVVDMDELLDRIRYEASKASLHFSIRALVKHGWIEKRGVEKRRGRQRSVIIATKLGIERGLMAAAPKKVHPNYVSTVEEADLHDAIQRELGAMDLSWGSSVGLVRDSGDLLGAELG